MLHLLNLINVLVSNDDANSKKILINNIFLKTKQYKDSHNVHLLLCHVGNSTCSCSRGAAHSRQAAVTGRSTCVTLQQADEPSSSSSSSLPPSLVSLEAGRNQSVGRCASGSVAADAHWLNARRNPAFARLFRQESCLLTRAFSFLA